jgi:hypothetical protein
VWIHYEPELADRGHPRFDEFAELGISRVMLMTTDNADFLTI